MTKNVKLLIIGIGALSLFSGVYLVYTGSEFIEYFSGLFAGVTLIGAALFYKEESDPEAKE